MTYVALLRGIGPTNPNMHPAKLKGAFEKMGFTNVKTVIASGNVVFDASSRSPETLEAKIEKSLPKILGFSSTTIIRSQEELTKLVAKDPFKGTLHGPKSYSVVTFFKKHPSKLRTLPRKGPGFKVMGVYKKELCVVLDLRNAGTPEMMLKFEKEFGREITTRTWKTVGRIMAKMA